MKMAQSAAMMLTALLFLLVAITCRHFMRMSEYPQFFSRIDGLAHFVVNITDVDLVYRVMD